MPKPNMEDFIPKEFIPDKRSDLEKENARLILNLGAVIRERDMLREELKLALEELKNPNRDIKTTRIDP